MLCCDGMYCVVLCCDASDGMYCVVMCCVVLCCIVGLFDIVPEGRTETFSRLSKCT